MQYQNIRGIKKPLSRIIYGCTTEAMMKGENVNELLDEIYALGINTFDTAENYGWSDLSGVQTYPYKGWFYIDFPEPRPIKNIN